MAQGVQETKMMFPPEHTYVLKIFTLEVPRHVNQIIGINYKWGAVRKYKIYKNVPNRQQDSFSLICSTHVYLNTLSLPSNTNLFLYLSSHRPVTNSSETGTGLQTTLWSALSHTLDLLLSIFLCQSISRDTMKQSV